MFLVWVSRVKFAWPEIKIRLIYQTGVSPLEREFTKLSVLKGCDGISQWFLLPLRYVILFFGPHLSLYFRPQAGNHWGIGCGLSLMSVPGFPALKWKYHIDFYNTQWMSLWYVMCGLPPSLIKGTFFLTRKIHLHFVGKMI